MPRRLCVVLATCALLLGACGGGSDGPGGAAPAPAPVGTEAQPAVPAVLDFTAAAIGGGDIRAARYAGRPVVLWFWSPW